MKKKDYLRLTLILAIFFLALGGWLLHLRIHPPATDAENYIPAVAGFISVIIIPVLFIFRATIPFAYLLNGMTVIIGTITMTHFSLENPPPAWTIQTILLGTCLPDIFLLWGKFAVGKALFDLDPVINRPDAEVSRGRFFRFPNMGFWYAHVVTLTVVYMIGKYFWK
ncbi:MAG: hypothetical protein CVU55_03770 [Deltaproteobacteria bacterium HGW-Deltaproteobacteria-13]|jgi:hypothetical protein|nr:MAG: hypothetical protein CVU55_03770 [Deltaproteobacteria bacterium HGW-Deltaproteobacteria-13]